MHGQISSSLKVTEGQGKPGQGKIIQHMSIFKCHLNSKHRHSSSLSPDL